MVVKITPKQSDKVNQLIRKLCCNYDAGNCLLLDDGEPCCCIQNISRYGIYCNYFLKLFIVIFSILLNIRSHNDM